MEARAVTATIEKTVAEVMEAAGMVWVAVVEIARVWRWGRRDCGNGVGDSDRFGDVGGRGGNGGQGNNRDGKGRAVVCVGARRSVSVCVGLCRSASVRVCPCRSMSARFGPCLRLSI